MPQSEYPARRVGPKTNEVLQYHRDDEQPGKPLYILIPGGLIALASLGLIIYIAYQAWIQSQLSQNTAIDLITILAPFYVGGVFLFSYGYELYNIPRALRLTAIIVFITVAAVVIVAVLALLAGGLKDGGGSSSKSSKSSSSSSSSSKPSAKTAGLEGFAGGLGAGMTSKSSSNSSSGGSSSHNSGGYYGGGNVFIGGGGGTRVETREVTKEVVKEVPKEPMPIACPFCGTSYVPAEHKYICPNCGAATPKNLIEESQMPKKE